MAKAWRSNFYDISQVSKIVFMAHFRSQEEMVSVFSRQPWTMGSDTMLLEWFDPGDNANSSSDYRFDHILVTVRAYGIPRERRSISLLADILNQVGVVSEFHILKETNLYAKQDYIWGTAKLWVNRPVKDRAFVNYSDNTNGLAYLNYEKIRRICLFCGVMFHTAQNCSLRNNLIMEKSKNRQLGPEIPVQRFGQWIVDERHIPAEVLQRTRIGYSGNTQAVHPILSRLQRLFDDDPKGKGKPAEEQMNRMSPGVGISQNEASTLRREETVLQSNTIGSQDIGSEGPYSTPGGMNPEGTSAAVGVALPFPSEERAAQTQHGLLLGQRMNPCEHVPCFSSVSPTPSSPTLLNVSPLHNSNHKRQAPSSILTQPLPKKSALLNISTADGFSVQSQLQLNASLPPIFPQPTPAVQLGLFAAPPSTADASPNAGILGARPAGEEEELTSKGGAQRNSAVNPTAAADGRARRRPSGWDIQDNVPAGIHNVSPLGTTSFQYGSVTWKRDRGSNEVERNRAHRQSRGIARHSSHGAFPPTQRVSDYYMTPSAPPSASDIRRPTEVGNEAQSRPSSTNDQGSVQDGFQQGSGGGVLKIDDKASAPASKVPRAP